MFYSSLACGFTGRGARSMVFLVNAENRHMFTQDLLEMHLQRRQVFVDTLGWPLPLAGEVESDQYDDDGVIYLLVKDDLRGRLRASVRLLRTDRPHLLLDVFPELCDGPVPRGSKVWEISRFCPCPTLVSRRDRLGLLRPLALNCGWDAVSLGATRPDRHDEVTAIAVAVTHAGLRRVQNRFGITGPVLAA
jgi:N-acyl-L-homoserine lactone synthetase